MNISREDAYLILNALPYVGWRTLQVLLKYFNNDPVKILSSNQNELNGIGLRASVVNNCLKWESLFNLEKEKNNLKKIGGYFISFEHESYPKLLKTIYNPPIGLYILGTLPTHSNLIAMVGSRCASVYGLNIAERFSSELAERGWCIVSGFARGIDTAAHNGALKIKGETIGVFGCGLDYIYPPENNELYVKMQKCACLISEFPLGLRADRMSFPRRNRILSGISQATVVIESDLKGGSMLTAGFASEQNRQVFAVPGNIDSPMSRGCHYLIRNGVSLVTCVDDVIDDLKAGVPLPLQLDFGTKLQELKSNDDFKLNENELIVYETLKKNGPLGCNEICSICDLGPASIQTILCSLEFDKIITHRHDGLFEA